MVATPDRIEREILIRAPLDRVWPLVAQPGWWISDGDGDRSGQVRSRDGAHEVLEDPRSGRHLFEVVAMERPTRAAYRWVKGAQHLATVVEFALTAEPDGPRLRVVERGIASLPGDRSGYYRDNAEGWAIELEIARRRAP